MASIPEAWLVVPAQFAGAEDQARLGPAPALVDDGGSARRSAELRPQTPDDGGSARRGAELRPQTPAEALVARALRRDEAALSALYAAHAPAILRFLADLLGDRAAAADATQETFVRAFRRLDTLRDADRIAPWLFGIARNVSLEHRKARRRRGRVLVQDDGEAPAEHADERTPESALLGREAAGVIEAAMGGLSEDRRAMLLLRLDHGLAYDEIAGLMGFTLAKVKVEIHRARQILRAELEAFDGGGARGIRGSKP